MTKNPKNPGKKLLALVAFATLFAFTFAGCKNFMKSDDDVKETMQQEVEVANAPEVTVRVQPSSDTLGAVTPNGQAIFKVNVPSTVLASEVTGGFIKWAAFYSGDLGTEVADAVTFTDAKAKETPVTLLVNRPDVVIQAMFEKRPQVTYYFPDPLNGDAYTNSPIRITFSKPIDPASLTSTVEGKAVNNITFTEYFAGITNDITTTKYGVGTLSTDGKVIVYKNTAPMSAKNTMTVKVAKAIRDTSGLEMADDYTFNFKVGTTADGDPPTLGEIAAGLTESYEFNASDAATRRITASQGPIYVRLRGQDIGAGIVSATITPTLTKYDDAGTSLGTVTYAAQTIPWIDDKGTPTSFSVADLTAGSADDGLITLSVVLTDGNENSTNPPATYNIVRDTAAPPVDPAQLARMATSGGYGGSGFYNRGSTVLVSNSTPLIDSGFAGGGDVPRLRSATVKYRVSMNLLDFSMSPESNWVLPGVDPNPQILLSSYTGPDGSAVPIYVQFRDDLKNASAPVTLKTIPVDNNAPAVGSISIANATASNGLKFVKVGSIDYTIKATDGISGVAKYAINTTGSTPADGEWVSCSSGADGTLTLTGSQGLTEGKNTLYAWFQDGAGNKTSTAVTDTVIYDIEKPTVSNFYLRETRNDSFTVKPKANDEGTVSQYSKGQSFYFMFIASDNYSGFSTFTYSDDKGSTSEPIPMQTGASAGSGDYKVSSINVAQLATKDGLPTQVLVTGILTIPANNSEHKLTVKVKDGAGNENDYVTSNDSNTVLFDNMVPEITSFNCETGSGYYLSGSNLFTNLSNPKVLITANDVPNGTNTVSGLKDAILSCSPSDWLAMGSVAFPASLERKSDSGTVTATLTVGSSETATISATPRDYAGNLGTTSSLTLIKDQTPPTLALYLYPPSSKPTGAGDAKKIKSVGSTEAIDCSAATHDFEGFYVGMIGYDTGGSGINGARVHDYEVIRRTKSGDQTIGSGKLIISDNDKITPDATTYYGENKSAVWLVRVKAMDNVGNVMDHYESVGYTYDITPPTIDNDSLIVSFTENGDMKAKKLSMPAAPTLYSAGEYYFIPGSALPGDKKVYVRIKATDKPSIDDGGSGITTVNGNFTVWDIGASSTRASIAEIATGEPSASYVPIAQDSTKSVSLSNVAVIMSTPTVTDKCGNIKTGGTFVLAVDDGLPTTAATPAFSKEGTGTLPGVRYISKTATLSFTPTDPETGGSTFYTRASGMFGYALTNSATQPDVPISGNGDWTPCSSSPVTISATDLQTLVGSGTTDLYLHLLDNAGNRNKIHIGNVRIDQTPPTLLGIRVADTVNAKSYDIGGVKYVTSPKFDMYATAADEASGSGIASFKVEMMHQFTGSSYWVTDLDTTGNIGANGEFKVSSTSPYDFTGAKVAMKFKITVWDKAGNHTESVADLTATTGQFEVRYDGEAPTASATFSNYNDSGTMTFISSGTTVSLALTDSDSTEQTPSGIKGWIIQKATDEAPTKDSSWVTYTDTTAGIAAANTAAAGKLLDIVTANHTKVNLYTIDNVDHVSAVHHLNGGKEFMVDLVPPTIVITKAVSSNPGVGGYYVGATPTVSFTAVDNTGGSGVNKYYFSTKATEDASTINTSGTDCAAAETDIPVTGFSTTDYNTVYLYVTDKAGMVSKTKLVDNPAKMDGAGPTISSVKAWNTSKDKEKTADDDGRSDVKIAYPANAETGSGVQKIRFTGNVASAANSTYPISVKLNGTPVTLASTDGIKFETGKITVTFANPVALSGPGFFYVYNLELTGSNPAYTAAFIDAMGNESPTAYDTIIVDTTPPTSVTFLPSDDDYPTITSFASAYARATGTFSENESSLETIAISGISGFTTPTVTCGAKTYTVDGNDDSGTVYKVTASGSGSDWALNLSPPYQGDSVNYVITGITLGDPDGEKNLSATFTNTAERSAGAASVSITRDTGAPTNKLQPTSTNVFPTTATLAGGTTTYYVRGTTTIKFDWTGTDPGGSGILGYVKAGTLTEGSSASINVSGSGVSFFSRDKVGNSSDAATVSVVEDTERPTFSLALKSGTAVTTAPLEVTAATTINVAASVYTKAEPVDYTITVSDSKSGPNDYTVKDIQHSGSTGDISLYQGVGQIIVATDKVNNESYTLTLSVNLDNGGPTVAVTPTSMGVFSNQGTYYNTTGGSVSFSVKSEDFAGIKVPTVSPSRTVTGTATGTVSTFTVDIPCDGTTYTITGEDGLGNPTTKTVKVVKDDAAPTMDLLSPTDVLPSGDTLHASDSKTYYTSVAGDKTFTLTATDATLKSYQLGTSTPVEKTTIESEAIKIPTDSLSHSVTVSDNLGNSSVCNVTIICDSTPPDTLTVTPTGTNYYPSTFVTAGNSGAYQTKNPALSVSLAAVDSGSGIAKCYATAPGETTVEDTTTPYALSLIAGKTWAVHAVNQAGLESTTTVTVYQDTTPPNNLSFTPGGTTGNGWYQTESSPLTYDANATMTFSLSADETSGNTSISIFPSGAWTPVSPTSSGNTYSWTGITIPANGTEYTLTLTDAVGNTTTQKVKVTSDTTAPSFTGCTWGTWEASGKARVNGIMQTPPSDIASSIDIKDLISSTTDSIASSTLGTNPEKDFIYDHTYTMTAKDRVGNSATVYFICVNDSGPKLVRINAPTSWGFSGTTITGLGVYTTGSPTIASSSGTYTSSTITGFPSSPTGNYTLTSTIGSKTMTITFSFINGQPASLSVLGSTGIAERLSLETVTASVRRESFNRARSSSKTNLPVWFTDAGKDKSSDPMQTTERDRSSNASASRVAFGSTASTAQVQSVEALHAAALSGMRATAASERKDETVAVSPEKAVLTTQGGIADTAVMTAPEGSPAFVAYARGVAALRDRLDGFHAVKVDRSSFMVSEGTKPAGLWERLLAFFGIRGSGSDLAENF